MREICLIHLDKTRPALILTRDAARGAMTKVTVAPITTTINGLSSEVRVGPENSAEGVCGGGREGTRTPDLSRVKRAL